MKDHIDFLKTTFITTEDSLTHRTPESHLNKDSHVISAQSKDNSFVDQQKSKQTMSRWDIRNITHAVDEHAFKQTAMKQPSSNRYHNKKSFVKSNMYNRSSSPVLSQPDPMYPHDDSDSDVIPIQQRTSHQYNTQPKVLSEKSFIYYSKSSQPTTVLDVYLPKLTTKMVINEDNDLISFYHTFRSRLESYNILIRNYEDINTQTGITLLNQTNSENSSQANSIMSRAIFNYLDDNKDSIMKNYPYGYKLLKYYESTHDGFAYLERLMERAHPKLRNPMTHQRERPKPQLNDSESIFDFIKLYLEWLQYESQELPPRTYNDSVKLNYIISQLQLLQNPSLSMAINYLISRRDILFCDPTHPQPLPPDLHLDRIGNTIWDRVDEESRNDLLNINPIVVNKANSYTKGQYPFNKHNNVTDLTRRTSSRYHKHQGKLRRKMQSRQKLNRRINMLEQDGIDTDVVNAAVMLCQDDFSSSEDDSTTTSSNE